MEEDVLGYWQWQSLLHRYFWGGNAPQNRPQIKEVWFAGSHADVLVIPVSSSSMFILMQEWII
jgi:hypothetical protein